MIPSLIVHATRPETGTTAWHRSRAAVTTLRFAGGLALAALVGCLFANDPYYCPGMPNDYCSEDSATTCTSDQQCSGATPVCDLAGTRTCVQCTVAQTEQCTGTAPVCGADQRCRGCSAHSDCSSAACLPDGACGTESDIAYVSSAGVDTAACTLVTPCTQVASGLATARLFVKLSGSIDEAVVIGGGRRVALLAAPGARLTRSAGGAVITVRDSETSVQIYDLTIADAPNNASGFGLLVPAGSGAPTVTMTRTTIENNPAGGISVAGGSFSISRSIVANNPGGGISISGIGTRFSITDNVVVYNGRALGVQPSSVGGLAITANTAGSQCQRNTIAFNASDGSTFRAGISCNAPLASASGNLMFHNTEPDGLGGLRNDLSTQANSAPSCSFGNSLAIATDVGHLGFKSPLVAPLDFHLTDATPASVRDAAGTCSGVDIDGDLRPIGGACDLGADEYQP
jgi:Right handed beta helix region